MFLRKDVFQTGCDLSKLYYGIHFPSAKNHPGFDAFLRLALASGDNLLVVVEDKYTEGFSPFFYFLFFICFKSGATYISAEEVAKKVCNTLKTYPCLVKALIEKRFCFILASFQNFAENKSTEFVANLVHESLQKKKNGKRIYSFDRLDEISVDLLKDCLVILRKLHLKRLLTPTLANRYHYLKSEANVK